MLSDFYINFGQFSYFTDKAIDWYIKSWGLGGLEKEIALLHRRRNMEKAMGFLKDANRYLDDIV